MKTETKKQIIALLEKNGYSLTHKKNTFLVNNMLKTPFFFYDFRKGLRFFCMYNISDYAQKNRLKYLNFIDKLNQKADIAKFHDYGDVMVASYWVNGEHDKKEFNHLLKLWEADLSGIPCSIKNYAKILIVESPKDAEIKQAAL
ncbi:MAG: hypothetical protein HF300_18105 [Ignavibacteria bacterium]|jgi:hypothetical protein|nr:hypothetical protein [Ignavibacteria bacterium]